MEIVDAQLHEPGAWGQWGGYDTAARRSLLTEPPLTSMDAVGVDAVLLFPTEDGTWAEELARDEPRRFAWVPMVTGGDPAELAWDLGSPLGRLTIEPDAPDIEAQIEAVRHRPGVVVLRIIAAGWPGEVARVREGGADASGGMFGWRAPRRTTWESTRTLSRSRSTETARFSPLRSGNLSWGRPCGGCFDGPQVSEDE
jgi:hypothetical protein